MGEMKHQLKIMWLYGVVFFFVIDVMILTDGPAVAAGTVMKDDMHGQQRRSHQAAYCKSWTGLDWTGL